MDLSKLKWPIIIFVVVGFSWLLSSPGVNYMYTKATKATVGENAEQDVKDEATLSTYGGYMLYMFRYQTAANFFETAIDRYGPNGANYYYNLYRLARCYEKQERNQESLDILRQLMAEDAHSYDDRVMTTNQMEQRAAKLKEVNGLQ
ncbi:MAG: tetratricopeptide repeat protein [Candidatus Hydrogenedentes bacterium]|nr:tetratricopeptide repeat protein [Candidatus Hydrogenedentota bacterium]